VTDPVAAARELLATVTDRLRRGYVVSDPDARLNELRVATATAWLALAREARLATSQGGD
jgi:hypothetical protein